MRSDSGNCTTEKSPSQFCYISRSTRQLYCMDFSLGEPERICNMFPYCHARRKNNFDDFVTYPEALSNCIAQTLAWVNQKGYVTCSYNVTQDGKKNHYYDFVTYHEALNNCIVWTSACMNQKGYITCHAGRKNHYHDVFTYPEVLSNCIATIFSLGEPETIFLEFPAPKTLTTRNGVRDKQTILCLFIEPTNYSKNKNNCLHCHDTKKSNKLYTFD